MLEKSILAIVLGYVVLTFSGNADASQNTHCRYRRAQQNGSEQRRQQLHLGDYH